MKSNFQFLYHFSSDNLNVVEIKLHSAKLTNPSEQFKWLVIHRAASVVTQLDFKSMTNSRRYFLEGELKWDLVPPELSLLGKVYSLKQEDPSAVSSEIVKLVTRYLQINREGVLVDYRALKPSDFEYFNDWIQDPDVIRFSLTRFHTLRSLSNRQQWFRETLFGKNIYQLGIIEKVSKKLIGYAGITSINNVDRNGEYFILIGDKSFWGKGVASEVTHTISKIGLNQLGLHRIFLTASSKNAGALRAYKKAGFAEEGTMREAFFRDGEYSDKIFMGMLSKNSGEKVMADSNPRKRLKWKT